MTPRGRSDGRVPGVLVLLLALLLGTGTACGAPPAPPIRVGAGPDPADRLVAEIYARGLELRGLAVTRAFDPASSYADLRDGRVDLVPAATGGLLDLLDPGATATAPADVAAGVRARLPPGLALLPPSAAEDTDAVVVTRAAAAAGVLRTVADLAPGCPRLTLGGPAAFATRPDGLPALARRYGCTVASYRPLPDAASTVAALRAGGISAAVLPSADPAIELDDLVVLADVDHAVTAQQIAPLAARRVAADPRAGEVLDRISSQLDTAVLTDLVRRTTGPAPSAPPLVARDWLSSAGVG